MSAAFTPGPWYIFRLNAKDGLLVVGVRGPFGPQKHIADICWAKDVADRETGATGLDDARLIAASPNLVAALQQAQAVLAELVEPDMSKRAIDVYARCRAAELSARTALRKALGEGEAA